MPTVLRKEQLPGSWGTYPKPGTRSQQTMMSNSTIVLADMNANVCYAIHQLLRYNVIQFKQDLEYGREVVSSMYNAYEHETDSAKKTHIKSHMISEALLCETIDQSELERLFDEDNDQFRTIYEGVCSSEHFQFLMLLYIQQQNSVYKFEDIDYFHEQPQGAAKDEYQLKKVEDVLSRFTIDDAEQIIDNIRNMYRLISNIELKPDSAIQHILSIGDELHDRIGDDLMVLIFLNHLLAIDPQFKSILSNHTLAFIECFDRVQSKIDFNGVSPGVYWDTDREDLGVQTLPFFRTSKSFHEFCLKMEIILKYLPAEFNHYNQIIKRCVHTYLQRVSLAEVVMVDAQPMLISHAPMIMSESDIPISKDHFNQKGISFEKFCNCYNFYLKYMRTKPEKYSLFKDTPLLDLKDSIQINIQRINLVISDPRRFPYLLGLDSANHNMLSLFVGNREDQQNPFPGAFKNLHGHNPTLFVGSHVVCIESANAQIQGDISYNPDLQDTAVIIGEFQWGDQVATALHDPASMTQAISVFVSPQKKGGNKRVKEPDDDENNPNIINKKNK